MDPFKIIRREKRETSGVVPREKRQLIGGGGLVSGETSSPYGVDTTHMKKFKSTVIPSRGRNIIGGGERK